MTDQQKKQRQAEIAAAFARCEREGRKPSKDLLLARQMWGSAPHLTVVQLHGRS